MSSIIVGKRIITSTSKTKKITAKRKNRVENGSRADRCGSNPHSNGESFSRLIDARVPRIRVKTESRTGNRVARVIEIRVRRIGVCREGDGKVTGFCYVV